MSSKENGGFGEADTATPEVVLFTLLTAPRPTDILLRCQT